MPHLVKEPTGVASGSQQKEPDSNSKGPRDDPTKCSRWGRTPGNGYCCALMECPPGLPLCPQTSHRQRPSVPHRRSTKSCRRATLAEGNRLSCEVMLARAPRSATRSIGELEGHARRRACEKRYAKGRNIQVATVSAYPVPLSDLPLWLRRPKPPRAPQPVDIAPSNRREAHCTSEAYRWRSQKSLTCA